MRALKSPAIKDRASAPRVWRKLSLNPRTPTSAATPTATESTTKPNLPGADFRSAQPIAAARFQLRARLAMTGLLCGSNGIGFSLSGIAHGGIWKSVLYNHAITQDDA